MEAESKYPVEPFRSIHSDLKLLIFKEIFAIFDLSSAEPKSEYLTILSTDKARRSGTEMNSIIVHIGYM